MKKKWGPDCGIKLMHKYYTNCDFLDDHVIDTILPEEGIPEGLNMEYTRDNEDIMDLGMSELMFTHWIVEARFDPGCDIARTLLHRFTDGVYSNAHANSTLGDFYHHLLHDIVDLYDADNVKRHDTKRLKVWWLARYIHKTIVTLPFPTEGMDELSM